MQKTRRYISRPSWSKVKTMEEETIFDCLIKDTVKEMFFQTTNEFEYIFFS